MVSNESENVTVVVGQQRQEEDEGAQGGFGQELRSLRSAFGNPNKVDGV